MTALSWASLRTPVGPVSVGCSPLGVARVRYGDPPVARAEGSRGPAADADGAAGVLADTARRELTEYFCGERRVFDVAVDWTATAGPHRQVLAVLAGSVGYGRTISYGALAAAAGLSDAGQAGGQPDDGGPPAAGLAARTVGTIMAGNPVPVIVPCHRVVASDGLGGYSGGAGIEVKRWLLILEGSLPPTLDWQPMTRRA
jgi:methylated-DNA-[protein]-cysteine S-methyltransferase